MRSSILLMFLAACGTAERESGDTGEACPTWYLDADGDRFGNDEGAVTACEQPAGTVDVGGDCDDGNAQVSPVGREVCGGADEDCDGLTDDADDSVDAATTLPFYADADGDGHGQGAALAACAAPAGHAALDDDCDDGDASRHPDAPEACDGVDHDCDGEADEPDSVDAQTFGRDADADAYGDAADTVVACDAPEGYVADLTDCDDQNGAIHPDAPEACDDVDQDCDGSTRDADSINARAWYPDLDADGYGDATAAATMACDAPADHVEDATDCDDGTHDTHPGAVERCNAADTDCDGETADAESVDAGTWYADSDGDGYGDHAVAQTACDEPAGFEPDDNDCDDGAATVYPGADESCNDVDDDCDGSVDENALDLATWYVDVDADGWGDTTLTLTACDQPAGYSALDGDCDPNDVSTFPGAPDGCDGTDHDCDGEVDEDDSTDAPTWYADADGDTYGDASDTTTACSQPADRVADDTDCDDADADVNPAEDEVCNSVDDDCDGTVDDDAVDFVTWFTDTDGDGYGDDATEAEGCTADAGSVAVGGDCDESDTTINPGEAEVCGDSVDEDCDGLTPLCFDGAYTDADATLTLAAPVSGRHLGSPVDADFDGDGQTDLLVVGSYNVATTAYGPGWLVIGPLTSTTTLPATPDFSDLGIEPGAEPGLVAGDDFTGDGVVDLLIGAYLPSTNGRTHSCIVELPSTALSTCTADVTWAGASSARPLEAVGAGDVDGDGVATLVGHVYRDPVLVYDLTGSEVGRITYPSSPVRYWSGSMSTGEDLFGAGFDSVAVASRSTSGDAVYVFDGVPAGATLADSDADVVVSVGTTNTDLQVRLVPDGDGDGYPDLVVHPAYTNLSYLFSDHASLPAAATASDAYAATATSGTSTSTWIGTTLAHLDADGDGHEDLLLGSTSDTVTLLYAPIAGTVDPDGCTPCARVTDSNPGADTERAWAGGDLFGNGFVSLAAIKTYASVFGGEDGVISLFEVGG